METKVCCVCGKELPITEFYQFLDKRVNKVVSYGKCKKCEKERRLVLSKTGFKAEQKVKKRNKYDPRELERINKEAWDCGMTYGQYVAKMYCEEERRRRAKE